MHDHMTDDCPLFRTVRVDLRADGTRYIQPGRPIDTLRAIVALVKTLPNGLKPTVDLGCRSSEALTFVMSLPGATPGKTPAADGTGAEIVYAWTTVDGVEIVARVRQERTRPPPTALHLAHERIAALQGEARLTAMRRLSRSYSVPERCVVDEGCTIDGSEVVWPDGERWPADPERLTPGAL